MRYTAILIAAMLISSAAVCEDPGETRRPRKESEDPSYEPMRGSGRAPSSKPPVKATAPATDASAVYAPSNSAPAQVDVPSGQRVKYILNGQPVYEGDPPVPGIDDTKSASSTNSSPVANQLRETPAEYQAPSGPRIKYILDGKPVYEGEEPRNATIIQQSVTVSSEGNVIDAQPVSRQTVAIIDDLTADKPGTPAAAETNPVLLEEYMPGEHLNTRAKQCYYLLSLLKKNVETVSRCLDIRGKENARLIHTSDEMSKNITDLADIWPGSQDYIEHCTANKRYALLFCDELSRTPWKWAQVRWSFDAYLKDVRGFREYCKTMADAELKQQPRKLKDGSLARLKDGSLIWEDVPDPLIDQLAAKQEEKHRIERETLARIRRSAEVRSEAEKNRMDTDLRNAR